MWLQLSQDDDSDESDDEDVEDGDGEDNDDEDEDDDGEAMEDEEEELGDDAVDQNFRLELMKVLQKQNALVGFILVALSCQAELMVRCIFLGSRNLKLGTI